MPKKHPLWGTVARDDAPRDARNDDARDDRSRSENRNRKDGRPAGRPGGPHSGRPEGRGDAPRGRGGRSDRQERSGRPDRAPHRDRPADGRRETRRDVTPDALQTPESPCSILPGVKPVLELLESDPGRVEAVFIRKGKRGREVDRIVELCREARVRFTFAEPHALDRLFASGQAIGQSIGQAEAEPGRPEPAEDDLFADDDAAWDILEGGGPNDGPADGADDDAGDAPRPGQRERADHSPRASRPSHSSHQGVIARVFDAGFADLGDILRDAPDAPLPLIVALDQVQDPGNVGTLARTLYALGAAGLVVVRHGGAALGGAAARAAAGALEKLPVAKVTNLARALDEADEAGYTVYAAGGAAGGATGGTGAGGDGRPGSGPRNPFTEPLRTPAVLVLGNEDTGIRPNVAKRCHFTLAIPMARDFDSLNVAQAGAILVGCFAARRHKG